MIKHIILAYYIINKIGAQSYLSPETGSDEGPSATGASPAAHGVSHCLLVVLGCEDSMQRCLERTWQTWNRRHEGFLPVGSISVE